MQAYHSLKEFPHKSQPLIVTIGNFDGVHLGHQKVIGSVVEEAKRHHAGSALITFKNHPAEVLEKGKEILRICTPLHKERLISALGIDYFFNLTFTEEFSKQDPETFLRNLKNEIHYRKLILGADARFGRAREGDREQILKLADTMGFEIDYLPLFHLGESPVTSSIIRHSVQRGELEHAGKLLGRPYSILAKVERGIQFGKELGIRTANLNASGLALPPFGVYLVKVAIKNKIYFGIANLGTAPTIKKEKSPLLEVHIFDFDEEIYGLEIEAILMKHLRQEIAFSSKSELAAQIRNDIAQAKAILAELRQRRLIP